MTNLSPIINARIECSGRTLKELGLHRKPVGYGTFEVDPFFSWYAHLFNFQGEKCILFVNMLTRYPVFAICLTHNEIQLLNAVLGDILKIQLHLEGVSHATILKFLEHLYQPELTKSKNSSLIGTAVSYEHHLHRHLEGVPESHRVQDNVQMGMCFARFPILSLKEKPCPYKSFSKELLQRYGESGRFDHDPKNQGDLEIKNALMH